MNVAAALTVAEVGRSVVTRRWELLDRDDVVGVAPAPRTEKASHGVVDLRQTRRCFVETAGDGHCAVGDGARLPSFHGTLLVGVAGYYQLGQFREHRVVERDATVDVRLRSSHELHNRAVDDATRPAESRPVGRYEVERWVAVLLRDREVDAGRDSDRVQRGYERLVQFRRPRGIASAHRE